MLKLGKRQSRPTMYLYITLYNLLLKIVAISCKPWIISFWTCPDEIEKHKILFWKSLHHWPKSCSQNSKHLKPSPSSLNKNLPMHRIPAKYIKDGITTRIQCLRTYKPSIMLTTRWFAITPSAYFSKCKSPVGLNMMHLRHVIVDLSPTLTLPPFFHRLREVAELRAVVAHSRPVLKLMIYPLFVQIVNATSIKPLVMITIII